MSDIQQFQRNLTRRLSIGALVSVLLGFGMLPLRTMFWNGVAFQFIGWGLIDLLIAWGGALGTRRRYAKMTAEQAAAAAPREARNMARILWINTALDVVYMLGGVLAMRFPGASNPFWMGTGIGIFIQGAFLFLFDWFHALRVPRL